MRVAAVDLGTNTTRLLVADVDDGRIEELHRETRITRLGEGVDARRRLLPVPIARVRNVLSEYRRTLESLGAERTLVVATSAVREGTLILDIGGGSTELIVDEHHDSLELGSVRQTERFLHGDPPERDELAACAAAVRSVLAERVPDEIRRRVDAAIGVAGTLTTLAALDLGLERYDRERVHGHRLSRDGARTQLERLAALPLTERRAVPALEPERAPVIVAGAVILVETLDFFGLDAIEASELDILDGAALAAAELPSPEEGAAPPGAYTYC